MGNISQTPALVVTGANPNIQQATVAPGVTIVQGNGIYVSNGLAYLAAATNANGLSGVALSAGSAGQVITWDNSDWNVSLAQGINLGATLSSGLTVYMSATSGAFTTTFADLTAGQVVVNVGQVYADGTVGLKPNRGGLHY